MLEKQSLTRSMRSHSRFVIQKDCLKHLCHYDLSVVNKDLKAIDDVWAPISDIYWGQGYHSVLYGNANGVMFVSNGSKRDYVTFDVM